MKEMLQGFWEPNNYGTRIEIEGDCFTVLWRNSPVLITTFSVQEDKDGYVVLLKDKGLRYEGASSDYATVTDCRLQDGKMYLHKYFPITGDSEEILSKTTNSRYGNVTVITDEMLPRVTGLWKTADGKFDMKIENGTLTWRFRNSEWEKPEAIAVVRYNYERNPESFTIVNKDPSKDYVCHLMPFRYNNGRLITQMLVYDAKAPEMIFEKVN
ncbi:MAG: hypothetical protein IJ056_05875 [Acidaminococcaceae bacterium]|nr:hypothetical protein [Acidaminococcaceae bacterium]MBQ9698313.1 hypothetical protein [Acidaminococcaceae bacterium]